MSAASVVNCLQQPFKSCLFSQIFLKKEETVDGIYQSQLLLTLPEGSGMGGPGSAEKRTSSAGPDTVRSHHLTPSLCV